MPSSLIHIQYCFDATVSQISLNLLTYSHIPTALVAIVFGLIIYLRQRTVASSSLLLMCFGFATWSFLDLNTWFPFLGAENTMFTWSLIDLTSLLFFFFAYRFYYAFIYEKDLPLWQTLTGFLLLIPTIITTFGGLNLSGFDTTSCEAIETRWIAIYPYFVQGIVILSTIALSFISFRNTSDKIKREQGLLAAIGVLLFEFFFFFATFMVTLLVSYTNFGSAYNITIYGLFGMPILLMFLGYLIVKYHAFNMKMFGAQALVIGLIALVGAQFFFATSVAVTVLVLATLVLTCIGGYFLVQSVRREIAAREKNEALAKDLAKANSRLRELDRQKSEFVSIASHQLRSPLTSIRGYTSMILEGSYGQVPQKMQEVISRINESSALMALSIEDFLNVSRIEQGRMKYEFANTDIKQMAERVVDELRQVATKKGLVLMFRSDCESKAIASVDPGKMRQIIYNLVDNSLKYTQKGSVDVILTDNIKSKTLTVAVKDTGVGMSELTVHSIFDKFIRAKNANSINVTGTGLGLYVAKQMADAMQVRIQAESEGEGKGSTFSVMVPLVE